MDVHVNSQKDQKAGVSVIPAKAGIQFFQHVLDPGFRRGDAQETFYETIEIALTGRSSVKPSALAAELPTGKAGDHEALSPC
jgi:hypothetical protein